MQLQYENSLVSDRAIVLAPNIICLYKAEAVELTLKFFHTFEDQIFNGRAYVHLDFSRVEEISAAAALMLFAKVTRCQCTVSTLYFKDPDKVVTFTLPVNKHARSLFRDTGLYSAIKPGGYKKLQRLWDDVNSPFRSGSDPSSEMAFVIGLLKSQFKSMPNQIVAAVQETYLNIAHHAYERFKRDGEFPFSGFMIGRWWQYAVRNKNKITIIIYDMGSGIPSSMTGISMFPGADSDEIHNAMQTGVTSSGIKGRGMGFDNIKRPIDLNASAEYLGVYSGRGRVIYRAGRQPENRDHRLSVGGTLIEWIFLEAGK
ncbi:MULTISPECIES: hypothetical protein [Pseudomonas syringae group]|uniref:hypothetical protein n=1 Tax=Pseudomonas syringae group TaxID=136849 RepID=UPI000F03FD17|nr:MULTISPECIES: hypothetical protein [Pseudomonas syringae group]MCF9000527.1 hypothetical protein [Pseudomonas syringae]